MHWWIKKLEQGLYKQCLMSVFPKYNCIYVKLLVPGSAGILGWDLQRVPGTCLL